MVPAAAVVDEVPDLARAVSRRRQYASEVRGEGFRILAGRDPPRSTERSDGVERGLLRIIPEHERPLANARRLRQVGVGNQDVRGMQLATLIQARWIAHHAEFEETADARVAGPAGERVGNRQVPFWPRAVLVFRQVDQVQLLV